MTTARQRINEQYSPAPLLADLPADCSDGEVADALGVSGRTVNRWRHGEPLSLRTAERCAQARGVHLSYFWPEYFGQVTAEDRRRAARRAA